MLHHIMVGTNDIERSKRFYDAVLAILGAGEAQRDIAPSGHMRLFYQHDGSMFCVSEPINDNEATVANGATIGFKCHSPEQVQAFHESALAQGGTCCEQPLGRRGDDAGSMYLAYLRDPDGNKLCAIYRPS